MIKVNKAKLQQFLDFRGWKQTDFAKAIGFDDGTVSKILNEKTPVTRLFMERACQITTASLGDLFFYSQNCTDAGDDGHCPA